MRIIISGGGTGGHIYPALAIAKGLEKKLPACDLLFIGAKGKMEMEKVPKAGFKIEGLWISGFQRKLSFKNLLFPVKLGLSLLKAARIIRKFRPDVVVGVGGYASGPTLEIATRLGIPTLIQEQNSFPGVTNRLLGKKVDKICVAFGGMSRYFPAEKLILTGNPVRESLIMENGGNKDKSPAANHYRLDPAKQTILVTGGSLGARSLNEAVEANAALLQSNPEIQVLWQCGSGYVENFKNSSAAALDNVRLVGFLDDMDLAYQLADLVVCRAGAITISELCCLGKPAILVPSPNVAEDHQTKNARAIAEAGGALLIEDKDADSMIPKALELLGNPEELKKMGKSNKILGKPRATDSIVEQIILLGSRT